MKSKSLLFSLSAVALWSTVATAFKLSLEGLTEAQLLFFATLASTASLLIIAVFSGNFRLRDFSGARNITFTLAAGFLNPFLYYIILFKAYKLLPAYEAQPLNYTWPIVLSLISSFIFKHKLTVRTLIGMFIAFIGVGLIATRGDLLSFRPDNPLGVILAVSSSVVWASYWILNLKDHREASVKLLGAFIAGSLYTFIYILFFDSLSINKPVYLAGAVYVGLFEMGITFFLWMKGLALSRNKARTSTLAFIAPFLSLIFISVLLKEKITVSAAAGLTLIIGGIIYQQTENNQN